MENTTSAAASTLTRSRLSLAIITAAATASTGYFLYRALTDAPDLEPADPSQRLHRSNAVRRRRRSLLSVNEADPHDVDHDHPHERRDSGSSYTSAEESQNDENAAALVRPVVLADGETVAGAEAGDGDNENENVLEDDWWNEPGAGAAHQRAGQNIVSLLFRVSEDNARRNAYVHRGCQCNACGIAPIRGIRYRCANCADFDLCETCESQGLHIKTHIFYKVKVPAPPFGPRQMQPVWYPGDPETCLRNLPRSQIIKLSKDTGFERPELEAFWEQWTFMANTEWREDPDDLCLAMDRKTFERCLVPSGGYRYTAPNLIHDRMFAFYDSNNDDLISFREFLMGLSYRKQRNKLKRIFEGYDIDRDGLVSRRDFLRIFRAYYVLYKQMHKDILEGLDDQVISSTEAQQLVSSRQPLSSFFGREGRVPQADDNRHMEGKIFRSDGEITITDGKNGVVNEDKPDTADREVILSDLFTKNPESLFSPLLETAQIETPSGVSDTRYWNGLLNPPTRVDELPALLNGDPRPGDEMFVPNYPEGQPERRDTEAWSTEMTVSELFNGVENGGNSASSRETQIESTRAIAAPAGAFTDRVPTESQLRAQHQRRNQRVAAMNRKNRATARRRLLDRWKRRRFYLDEEEGAVPPDGWDDDEDVLNDLDGMAESSKVSRPAPLSPRSRSSSKVRFAEDDDYEIRSNHSTSSRSVPERWGGMDIPDAERDAGKEVLYQVTQQAFNELLDILFKAKEDLAIKAAETKDARNQYRSLFENIDLEEVDKKKKASSAQDNGSSSTNGQHIEPALEELLRITGYTVDDQESIASSSAQMTTAVIEEVTEEYVDELPDDLVDVRPLVPERVPAEEQRDPTMPQFRPNSIQDAPRQATLSTETTAVDTQHEIDTSASQANSEAMPTPVLSSPSKSKAIPSSSGSNQKKPEKNNVADDAPDHRQLVEYKRVDAAEEEAKARGGWGKLSFAEFEEIYRREETEGNRLDYLGSWIDFCIP